ncbi:hypothetical protein E2C01_036576 [Portunus trituberculatus]|uniref:Uncharacterized protein n=1 Tax=Portunus trituberculatus TaxID=210409 RepID=A0A5B7F918_PORTR|nr:hypothetical protein [Portunus trituberculatus]
MLFRGAAFSRPHSSFLVVVVVVVTVVVVVVWLLQEFRFRVQHSCLTIPGTGAARAYHRRNVKPSLLSLQESDRPLSGGRQAGGWQRAAGGWRYTGLRNSRH